MAYKIERLSKEIEAMISFQLNKDLDIILLLSIIIFLTIMKIILFGNTLCKLSLIWDERDYLVMQKYEEKYYQSLTSYCMLKSVTMISKFMVIRKKEYCS
jgi:hypothetical protein